jgi:hypothetical protein
MVKYKMRRVYVECASITRIAMIGIGGEVKAVTGFM